jgi:hypothetical protein
LGSVLQCSSGQEGIWTNGGLLASGSGIYLKLCIVFLLCLINFIIIDKFECECAK